MLTVYSTNCPKCYILIKKLQDSGREFNVINTMEDVYEASKKFDIQEAPFLVTEDDKCYNFSSAIRALASGEI